VPTPLPPEARPHERTARHRLSRRLRYLLRQTCLSPFWLDMVQLRRAIVDIAPSASGRLLDVGVGERPYADLFAPHVSRYVGVEYPPACENLSPGITRRVHAGLGIVDAWCDGHHLPFADGTFDTVLSLEVFEHVPDPDGMLAEMHRVLRPGGRLLVTVPFLSQQHALPYDFWRYTPQGLRAMLEQAGFTVERTAPRGNLAHVTGSHVAQWMMRALASRELKADGNFTMSRWRAPLVMPFMALSQLFFAAAGRWLPSDSVGTFGFAAVARRSDGPAPPPGRG
jgi:SAM-dependent methyltransferase